MPKHVIYFVPGLAASTKIFEYLDLDESKFELHYLNWILPATPRESISEYAARMCAQIQHPDPILVGVSFGGVMVQEMSKLITTKKVVIISSIKSNKELPTRLKLAQKTKAYKLFPSKMVSHIEDYEKYFFNDYLKKRAELYKLYLSFRDERYLDWAIYNVLHWSQTKQLPDIVHIHGNKDEIFPVKNIDNAILIESGTHIMILNKAKTISKILEKQCFLLT